MVQLVIILKESFHLFFYVAVYHGSHFCPVLNAIPPMLHIATPLHLLHHDIDVGNNRAFPYFELLSTLREHLSWPLPLIQGMLT
jgi:hypothetical protein